MKIKIPTKKILLIFYPLIFFLFCIFLNQNFYGENTIKLPIISYKDIQKEEDLWNKETLSPIELEKDLIYLKQNGFTTVFVEDIIEYVDHGKKLPEKPVVLIFEDGLKTFETYALPLLEKYDMKASVSIVGKLSEEASSDSTYLSFEDISRLFDTKRVSFINHTYDLHSNDENNGILRKENENFPLYRSRLIADIFKTGDLLEYYTGEKAKVFSFPFGKTSAECDEILKMCEIKATVRNGDGINYLDKDKKALFNLKKVNRSGLLKSSVFMDEIF